MNESNARPASSWLRWLPLIVLVLAVAGFLAWRWFGGAGEDAEVAPPPEAPVAEETVPAGPPVTEARTPQERRWRDVTGSDPVWPADFDRPADCAAVVADLRAVTDRLDERLAAGDRPELSNGSFALLTGAARDLAERQPVVQGELTRHETVLANVSHLFRVLGERRLRALQAVMDEDDFLEPLALDLYRWARVRERCGEADGPVGPGFDAQYQYASFLIQTVGGQAYLRRRAPRVEALAGFYALKVLDDAVERGYNPHGVDLRGEIGRVRALLEGTDDLVYRERYLEIVREMESRWRNRTALVPAAPR